MGGQGVIWTNLCPRCDAPWGVMTEDEWSQRFALAENYLHVQTDHLAGSVRQQKIAAALTAYAGPSRQATDLPVAGRYEEDGFPALYRLVRSADGGRRGREAGDGDAGAGRPDRRPKVTRSGAWRRRPDRSRRRPFVVAGGAIGTPKSALTGRAFARKRWAATCPTTRWRSARWCWRRNSAPRQASPTPNRGCRSVRARPPNGITLVLHDVSPFEPAGNDAQIEANRLVEIQSISPVDIDADKRAIFHDDGRVTFDVRLSDADLGRMAGGGTGSRRHRRTDRTRPRGMRHLLDALRFRPT